MAGIGIPMSTIKDAYGHSSIKVTERGTVALTDRPSWVRVAG